jgi:bacterioferritin-associated ferredoxin
MSIILIDGPPVYICICNAITEGQVKECARSGMCSVEELSMHLGVGTGCGRCRESAAELLQDFSQSAEARS